MNALRGRGICPAGCLRACDFLVWSTGVYIGAGNISFGCTVVARSKGLEGLGDVAAGISGVEGEVAVSACSSPDRERWFLCFFIVYVVSKFSTEMWMVATGERQAMWASTRYRCFKLTKTNSTRCQRLPRKKLVGSRSLLLFTVEDSRHVAPKSKKGRAIPSSSSTCTCNISFGPGTERSMHSATTRIPMQRRVTALGPATNAAL